MENYIVTDNKDASRFEISLGNNEYAFITYRWIGGALGLMHTEVPPSAQGKGIAAILAKYVLGYARQQGLQIVVHCSYIAGYIKKHPEYAGLQK